jgi:hypothetical protein
MSFCRDERSELVPEALFLTVPRSPRAQNLSSSINCSWGVVLELDLLEALKIIRTHAGSCCLLALGVGYLRTAVSVSTVPLVSLHHGYSMSDRTMESLTTWKQIAKREKFVLVFADGALSSQFTSSRSSPTCVSLLLRSANCFDRSRQNSVSSSAAVDA